MVAVEDADGASTQLVDGRAVAVDADPGTWRYFTFGVGASAMPHGTRLRPGARCGAPEVSLGPQPTVAACASACAAATDCTFFVSGAAAYGAAARDASERTACAVQQTVGSGCPEGWRSDASVDFYRIEPSRLLKRRGARCGAAAASGAPPPADETAREAVLTAAGYSFLGLFSLTPRGGVYRLCPAIRIVGQLCPRNGCLLTSVGWRSRRLAGLGAQTDR